MFGFSPTTWSIFFHAFTFFLNGILAGMLAVRSNATPTSCGKMCDGHTMLGADSIFGLPGKREYCEALCVIAQEEVARRMVANQHSITHPFGSK
jgi:hypothetical protein